MSEQIWQATGLTCDHCAQSITKNLMALAGMESVTVDVHPESLSTVKTNGAKEFNREEIAFAMREAGRYILQK